MHDKAILIAQVTEMKGRETPLNDNCLSLFSHWVQLATVIDKTFSILTHSPHSAYFVSPILSAKTPVFFCASIRSTMTKLTIICTAAKCHQQP